MKKEYIECVCSCNEHLLRFTWDSDPEYPEIFVSVFLNNFGFIRRLWLAIKYVFGFKPKHGYFSETILRNREIKQLRNLCDEFLNTHFRPPISGEEKIKVAKTLVLLRKTALKKAEERLEKIKNEVYNENK